jgi:hypothetical protein
MDLTGATANEQDLCRLEGLEGATFTFGYALIAANSCINYLLRIQFLTWKDTVREYQGPTITES